MNMDTTDGIFAGKGFSCRMPFFYAAQGLRWQIC
jgi:hypothetical protein